MGPPGGAGLQPDGGGGRLRLHFPLDRAERGAHLDRGGGGGEGGYYNEIAPSLTRPVDPLAKEVGAGKADKNALESEMQFILLLDVGKSE